ncbi:hypothetical protein HanIR_Chr04g0200931 [Helianthus annuus]|nr:hypothetical protein HanIR_Chr04g0200931 [Helianthus annuus]
MQRNSMKLDPCSVADLGFRPSGNVLDCPTHKSNESNQSLQIFELMMNSSASCWGLGFCILVISSLELLINKRVARNYVT